LKAAAFCIAVAIAFLSATGLVVGQVKQVAPAPIPAQILTARRVFVGNAGGDERPYEDPQFSGGADRTYNEFYAALKNWGRYELVAAPVDADLLFEISFSKVEYQQAGTLSSALYDPQFRLLIRDPKTNAVLWGLTEHVQGALLQGNHDKNFSQALARIVAEVQRIAAPSSATEEGTKKQ
jgi:hypothetical protein